MNKLNKQVKFNLTEPNLTKCIFLGVINIQEIIF